MDFDLLLNDRISVIRSVNEKYDLETNSYLSFSGGKDSTILHYLLDIALPNNNIPRVYVDTGIEYQLIREFVLFLAKNDKRFIIIRPSMPVIPSLRKFGYPFKSKEHSALVNSYQKGGFNPTIIRYINRGGPYGCPDILKYQFSNSCDLKISKECCNMFKKLPFKSYQEHSKRFITLTGMRTSEGGLRSLIKGCILTDKTGNLIKFHPLLVCDNEFENDFILRFNIKLCSLYYPPYNFKRTGCVGCPYNPLLKEDLLTLKRLLPNEYNRAFVIWKPVYTEYQRIGYRLPIYYQESLL